MIRHLCAELKKRGSSGVHLEMNSANLNALRSSRRSSRPSSRSSCSCPCCSFYKSLGFQEIARVTLDGKEMDASKDDLTPLHSLFLGLSL